MKNFKEYVNEEKQENLNEDFYPKVSKVITNVDFSRPPNKNNKATYAIYTQSQNIIKAMNDYAEMITAVEESDGGDDKEYLLDLLDDCKESANIIIEAGTHLKQMADFKKRRI